MPKIQLAESLDKVEIGFKVIPAGWYTLEIQSEPVNQASRKSQDQYNLVIEFTVTDPIEHQGHTMRHFCSMNPEHYGMPTGLKAVLESLKKGSNLAGDLWDEEGFDTADLVGLNCEAYIIQETPEPKQPTEQDPEPEAPQPQNRIKKFRR